MSRQIEIKCIEDGSAFKLSSDILSRSNFLKNIIETYSTESVIDIPDIKGSVMTHIVDWLEYHKDREPIIPPQPLRTYDIAEAVGKWEDEFMNKVYNKNFNNLFAFLTAVNFLDIPALLELASAKTACLTKDLSAKEFKELFKIQEDCSEDDIKKIEEEVLKEREILKEKERQRIEEEELAREEAEKNK